MNRLNALARRVPVWVVSAGMALPGLWLVAQAMGGALGPDPVKAVEHRLGELALQLLLLGLCITPLRKAGLNLLRFRRALGLAAFTYVVLHVLAWGVLDMALRWAEMAADLVKRPHILAGVVAVLALIPLAVTSTDGWVRRLGALRWRRLHRLVYPAALASVIHLMLLQKVLSMESLAYLAVLAALLLLRLPNRRPDR